MPFDESRDPDLPSVIPAHLQERPALDANMSPLGEVSVKAFRLVINAHQGTVLEPLDDRPVFRRPTGLLRRLDRRVLSVLVGAQALTRFVRR